MLTRAVLVVGVLLLAGACSPEAEADGTGLAAPSWTIMETAPDSIGAPLDMVGGPAGFVARGEDGVAVSADGTSWTLASPPRWRSEQSDLATDGTAIYLTGNSENPQEQYVWRYAGEGQWDEPVILRADTPLSQYSSFGRWAMVVGNGQVVLTRLDSMKEIIEMWVAPVGSRVFAHGSILVQPWENTTHDDWLPPQVITIEAGIYVFHQEMYGAVDLVLVPPSTAEAIKRLPETARMEVLAVNGERLAVHGSLLEMLASDDPEYVEDPYNDGSNEGYRTTAWCASGADLRSGSIDMGDVPDAGVGLFVGTVMVAFGSGFMLLGSTIADENAYGVAGVWTSSDGCSWEKSPVRANGLDRAQWLAGIATSGEVTLLLGKAEDPQGQRAVLWRAT